MQTPLLRGRAFADSDRRTSVRVGIVNRAFARRYFGDRNPVGRAILLGAPKGMRVEIVGVVGDTAHTSLTAEPPPLLHLPYAQRPFWITSFFIRTTGDPQNVASAFRSGGLLDGSHDTGAGARRRWTTILQQSFAASRHRTLLLGLLSAVALILAAVGMYGLLAFTVARRTNEIGIRLALGAAPSGVRRLVIGQALRLALAGMALGLAISLVVTRFLASLLFRVSANRSVDCGWRQRAPRPRDARRLLRACAPGDECRSARHAPLRIAMSGEGCHSYLKATSGSTRAARIAGTALATHATMAITPATAANVAQSNGVTPYNRLDSN